MTEILYIFISQFVMITLVGLNQLNVVHDHFYMAMITSSMIGVCSFFNISVVSEAEAFSGVWWAFITAGGLAIGVSMKIHPWVVRTFNRVGRVQNDSIK